MLMISKLLVELLNGNLRLFAKTALHSDLASSNSARCKRACGVVLCVKDREVGQLLHGFLKGLNYNTNISKALDGKCALHIDN